LANTAIQRISAKRSRGEAIQYTAFSSQKGVARAAGFIQPELVHDRSIPAAEAGAVPRGSAVCPPGELHLSPKKREGIAFDWLYGTVELESTTQTVPARRMICHPKEWSEFIPIICHGWAVSSITLPDGRRQILSFVLAGDPVSTVGLLWPLSGRAVEAVTEVTYRKFKRSDLKAYLFGHPELLERISKTWVEEKMESDQLALDLGRRTADERIARLILKLAQRIVGRDQIEGRTLEFPLRQRHIADATGLTPVHVSKTIGVLQRAKLIDISNRSLTVINEKELRRVADWR
jgi:CRP-like cAMP-binding protein